MPKHFTTFYIILLSLSAIAQEKNTMLKKWLIQPGESIGYIKKQTNREDLNKIFSHQDIEDDINLNVPKTIIYPGLPNELTIYWKDQNCESIHKIVVSGTYGSQWALADGLRIKQEITNLIKANGKDFHFKKFRSAPMKIADRTPKKTIVINWDNGLLSKYKDFLTIELIYNFACEETELNIHRYQGEGTIYTNDPELYTVQIFINQMILHF